MFKDMIRKFTATINSKSYSGNNIQINNGRIIIDGVDITSDINEKVINVSIEGNVDLISKCDNVTVKGNVNKVDTGAGDIDITGDVAGDIKTGAGDITVRGNVSGNVKTSAGDIEIYN